MTINCERASVHDKTCRNQVQSEQKDWLQQKRKKHENCSCNIYLLFIMWLTGLFTAAPSFFVFLVFQLINCFKLSLVEFYKNNLPSESELVHRTLPWEMFSFQSYTINWEIGKSITIILNGSCTSLLHSYKKKMYLIIHALNLQCNTSKNNEYTIKNTKNVISSISLDSYLLRMVSYTKTESSACAWKVEYY